MRTKPRKANSRKKSFIVYGKFYAERVEKSHIEIWTGDARNMASAVRLAVSRFWKSKHVKWKHHRSVNLQVQTNDLLLPIEGKVP